MTPKRPFVKGEKIKLNIDNLNSQGEGVGRYNNFVVFVPKGVPGDELLVEIKSIQKSFARGIIEKILKTSPERIKAPCSHYGQCGGCQLQHISYPYQLKFKTGLVRDTLKKIASIPENKITEIAGMKHPTYYRNKAQIQVGLQENIPKVGYFTSGSHTIIEADNCLIQNEGNNKITVVFKELISKYNLSIYNKKTGRGLIRHVISKVSSYSEEIMVIIVTNGKQLPHGNKIIEELKSKIPEITSIIQNINTRKENVILGKQNVLLYGKEYITEKIGDLFFRISPQAFFQVNTTQTKVLYDFLLDMAELTGKETVMDLYCGTGSIALYLAAGVQKVYGIEINPDAIKDARLNADINKLVNSKFFEGRVENVLPLLMKKGIKPDIIVVDPPRKGCAPELLDTILHAVPEKIIYVSCNPSTLARDLKILCDELYDVVEIQPVDMFPYTSHVECLVMLRRR